jgi:hypothetical protein
MLDEIASAVWGNLKREVKSIIWLSLTMPLQNRNDFKTGSFGALRFSNERNP